MGFWLACGAARAHAVSFDITRPAGAGNRTDAGVFVFAWTDGPDPAGTTLVRLFASRPSLAPWGAVDGGVELTVTPGAIAIADPTNAFAWDSAGAAPGCYQPWARLTDPLEGASTIAASGLVTVSGAGNVPPSVWITNAADATASDAGQFDLTFSVDDPDDATFVTLEAQTPTGSPLRLATDLPVPLGGGTGSFPVSTSGLDAGVWYLHASVRSGDGGTCDAWWPGSLYVRAPSSDAGVDAGAPDSGLPDGGDAGAGGGTGGGGANGTGGGNVNPPGPCGCSTSGAAGALALAALGLVRRRRG